MQLAHTFGDVTATLNEKEERGGSAMSHLLRIIGLTGITLLLIGAAFAIAISGTVLSSPPVHLGVAGVGEHRTPEMSDPCVSAARMVPGAERAVMC
jgi:hypothetical protein